MKIHFVAFDVHTLNIQLLNISIIHLPGWICIVNKKVLLSEMNVGTFSVKKRLVKIWPSYCQTQYFRGAKFLLSLNWIYILMPNNRTDSCLTLLFYAFLQRFCKKIVNLQKHKKLKIWIWQSVSHNLSSYYTVFWFVKTLSQVSVRVKHR